MLKPAPMLKPTTLSYGYEYINWGGECVLRKDLLADCAHGIENYALILVFPLTVIFSNKVIYFFVHVWLFRPSQDEHRKTVQTAYDLSSTSLYGSTFSKE